MQLCKTKPTKTNLTIQTYRTKHTEPKLLDQTGVTKHWTCLILNTYFHLLSLRCEQCLCDIKELSRLEERLSDFLNC